MSAITIMLIILVALLAGMEGILDEFQFHQPLVACTLIGLVSGHLSEGIILGGSLQMIALGWANVGAAVAPDAALASVASAIIMVLGLNGGTVNTQTAISTSIAVAIPLSVAGLFLTMICRTIAIPLVHLMDGAAEKGDFRKIEIYQILGILLQGVRIAVPAAALCIVPAEAVTSVLNLHLLLHKALCPAAQRLLYIFSGDVFPVNKAGIQSQCSVQLYAFSEREESLLNTCKTFAQTHSEE